MLIIALKGLLLLMVLMTAADTYWRIMEEIFTGKRHM